MLIWALYNLFIEAAPSGINERVTGPGEAIATKLPFNLMLLVGKENPVFKSLFQGQFLHSCLSQTHRTSLKSSWNTLSKISWQLGCKLQRGEEKKDAPLLSFFLYGLPHLASCWGWWLSPSSSRDFVLLSGGLTLASRQSPIQLCHSFQQAVWTYLLSMGYTMYQIWKYHGSLHVLKGNLCSITWTIWQPPLCGAPNAFTQSKRAYCASSL